MLPGEEISLVRVNNRRSPSGGVLINRRLKSAEIAQLTAEYVNGATLDELAERYRVTRRLVQAHLKRQGVSIRQKQALKPDDIDRAVQLYTTTGKSSKSIAQELHVSASTIRRALNHAGVVMRPPGRKPVV